MGESISPEIHYLLKKHVLFCPVES